MGLIARQSVKAGSVTYAGAALGMLNTVYIYPKLMSVEQYGQMQFMFSIMAVLAPLILFGQGTVLNRFFPNYAKTNAEKSALYGYVFGNALLNILIFIPIAILLHDYVVEKYATESAIPAIIIYAGVALSILQPFIRIAQALASNFGRIAIPSLLTQVLKVVVPLLVIVFYYGWLSFDEFIIGVVLYFVLATVLFLVYAFSLDKARPTFKVSKMRTLLDMKAMYAFAGFGAASSLATVMANQIDIQMITSMRGSYDTGIYSWGMFIALTLAIPHGLISSISTPLIAQHWKNNSLAELRKVYGQSSLSLMVLSVGLFVCIAVGIDYLFELMPKGDEYMLAKATVFLLCISKIVDMSFGLSGQMITMSSSYKYLLGFMGAAVVLNIGLNLALIPTYGIEGSAVATIVSTVVFNMSKHFFLYRKYQLQPFNFKSFIVVLLGLGVFGLVYFIPDVESSLVNLIVHSGVAFITFYAVAYWLSLSPEINEFMNKQLKK